MDVRLTAEDGYQAQRSYSIATPADGERLVLTVEELDDGEVSPFLTEELRPGDRFELRGPIGGYFVWDGSDGGPLHLVAGGSGVVPLMAMLRHRARGRGRRSGDAPLLVAHARGRHLPGGARPARAEPIPRSRSSTRSHGSSPTAGAGTRAGSTREMLAEVFGRPDGGATAFVCGPTRFVEVAADGLVGLGYEPGRVRTERFGPSGT